MKVKKLPFDVYRQDITFLYGTPDEITRWFKRTFKGNAEIPTFGPHHFGKMITFVPNNQALPDKLHICLVKCKRHRDDLRATLSHECLHLAIRTMEAKGIPITIASDEALTYYHHWLFSMCLLYLRTP